MAIRNRTRPAGLRDHVTPSILKTMSVSLLLKLLATASTFGISVVLARVLGPAGYGTYTLSIVLIMLLATPLQNGMAHLVVRDTARLLEACDLPGIKSLLAWAVRSLLLVAALIIGITVVISWAVHAYSQSLMPQSGGTLLIGLSLVATIPLSVTFGSTIRGVGWANLGQLPDRNLRPILFLGMLTGVWFFGLNVPDPTSAIVMHAFASTLAMIFAILSYFWVLPRVQIPQNVQPAVSLSVGIANRDRARSAMNFAAVALLQLLNGSIGVMVLGFLRSEAEVGVYRVVFQLAALTSFGVAAINPSIHARFAALIKRGDLKELQRVVSIGARLSLLIAALPALALLLFPGEILDVLYGDGYVVDPLVVTLLVAGQLSNVAFGAVAALMNMAGLQSYTLRAMLMSVVLNCIITIALVPGTGAFGAALGAASGLLAWNAVLWVQVRRKLRINSAVWSGRWVN